jgi:hypothetical protein
VFIGVATAWEFPLLKELRSGPRPDFADFVAINSFSAALILIVAVIVRLNGYALYARDPARQVL